VEEAAPAPEAVEEAASGAAVEAQAAEVEDRSEL
jgi:hypothetical protein